MLTSSCLRLVVHIAQFCACWPRFKFHCIQYSLLTACSVLTDSIGLQSECEKVWLDHVQDLFLCQPTNKPYEICVTQKLYFISMQAWVLYFSLLRSLHVLILLGSIEKTLLHPFCLMPSILCQFNRSVRPKEERWDGRCGSWSSLLPLWVPFSPRFFWLISQTRVGGIATPALSAATEVSCSRETSPEGQRKCHCWWIQRLEKCTV